MVQRPFRKVITVGLDGLEPRIVNALIERGELPNLAALRTQGGYRSVGTTYPAQTPVAWATFSTGTNPGGHGIFDFIRRNPETYLPDLGLNRIEQTTPFLPPKVVNLRRGTPIWQLLSDAGIPSVVLRCPCTFGPERINGRVLSGMGVPDLRGGIGTGTFYTSDKLVTPKTHERVVHVERSFSGPMRTHLIGPRNPKTGEDCQFDLKLTVDSDAHRLVIESSGEPNRVELQPGQWSDWISVRFKIGMLQTVKGIVRFFLRRLDSVFELYASPLNFDPDSPMFPISSPPEYSRELAAKQGKFYTTGMVEDHEGLNNDRFDEDAFLTHCDDVSREREAMLIGELELQDEGFIYCLFDTPDRIQHMFWRFNDHEHPAFPGDASSGYAETIAEAYRRCDAIVGRVREYADDRTLLIALSDHGFNSFRRGMQLNNWLHENGFLTLKSGVDPHEASDLLRDIDWGRTQAYGLGLSGIYLNVAGREAEGAVKPDEALDVAKSIASALTVAVDPANGRQPVRSVKRRREIYSGAYAAESPDLIVNFDGGYRVSWETALGGFGGALFEDNTRKWSGDHIIDPSLVPGVLFMNRPIHGDAPSLVDLAPTILEALGVSKGTEMEGESLLS